ncbi:MAG: hypothetical protein RL172_344 [Bacteroidota bacterium]|jgi:ketosteroid isomerase-like protein
MRHILLFTIVWAVSACSDNKNAAVPSPATFDLASVKNHIAEMNKSYSQRFTTADTAYYIQRYCKDAEVYCPGVAPVKSRDSIISFFYANGTNKDTQIQLPIGNVYGSDGLVVEEGTYNFPDGKGGSLDNGKFIALWKQEDGVWKLYREIWNSNSMPR